MQTMFNSKERTLREHVSLALSAGWKIVKVTKTTGSLFGYLIAIPVPIPGQIMEYEMCSPESPISPACVGLAVEVRTSDIHDDRYRRDLEVTERASSRCGTPTFGSNMRLSSVQEALAKFGGGITRSRDMSRTVSTTSNIAQSRKPPPVPLKPALSLNLTTKKRPSPLSVPPLHGSPPPASMLHSPRSATFRKASTVSPRQESTISHSHSHSQSRLLGSPVPAPKTITRRKSLANLNPTSTHHGLMPPPPLPALRQPPPSPLSPRYPNFMSATSSVPSLTRRSSHAQLSQAAAQARSQELNLGHGSLVPSFIPVRTSVSSGEREPPRSPGAYQTQSSAFQYGFQGPLLGSPPNIVARGTSITQTNSPRTVTRRSSYATLPQVPLRKRSGTVIGPAFGATSPYCSNLREGDTGMEVDFGSRMLGASGGPRQLECREGSDSKSPPSTRASTPRIARDTIPGGTSVLTAAAMIERGQFALRSPSP